ncbi:hypothetical protein CTA1_7278 [Colletotrichum tanaceti]|uniref:Uncharacterized protein n=1 Tax=Colletotrichum tanaceti TaxID=1306861 RepID=A0A4U6X9L5_9PEZI|nr:hypothetical protein CTA1_7278 [Colletotrichum tanaceti]
MVKIDIQEGGPPNSISTAAIKKPNPGGGASNRDGPEPLRGLASNRSMIGEGAAARPQQVR